MDLNVINDLITKLEGDGVSLSNVRNLSALYSVRDHLLASKPIDETAEEIRDILPSYVQYVEIKRKYQMGDTLSMNIYAYLNTLCTEILEFMQTLYNNTDTAQEREIIHSLIKKLAEL